MSNMKDCAWPNGCHQTSLPDDDLCSYHAKVRDGALHVSAKSNPGRPVKPQEGGTVKSGHKPGSETRGKKR